MQPEQFYISTRATLNRELPAHLSNYLCDILDRCIYKGYSDENTGFTNARMIIKTMLLAWDFKGGQKPTDGENILIIAIYVALKLPNNGDLFKQPEI